MFYSQTFLARKGPLGTVWCAAHLQHRLRKSHYTSTDLISTVDRIMFPEVPIALRMSGHLLLGVVRIYSKKVEYLVHDCNVMLVALRRAFATADVTLPENASTAKPESVTLPPVLDFDALNLDYLGSIHDRFPDNNLVSAEDITLPNQFPQVADRDQYIAITFDEDLTADVGAQIANTNKIQGENTEAFSDQTEILQEIPPSDANDVTEGVPSTNPDEDSPPMVEVLRHEEPVSRLGELPSFLSEELPKETEKNLEEPRVLSPIAEDFAWVTKLPDASETRQILTDLSASRSPPVEHDPPFPFGETPDFALRSSPIEKEIEVAPSPRNPQPRRKRKFPFDKNPVLNNKFMKQSLDDTKDLRRDKRAAPSSSLALYKFNKKMRKEKVFFESSLTGLNSAISNLFEEGFVASKHMQISSAEAANSPVDDRTVESFPTPVPETAKTASFMASAATEEATFAPSSVMENEFFSSVEHLRDSRNESGGFWTDLLSSPSRTSSLKETPSLTDNMPSSLTASSLRSQRFPSSTRSYGSELGSTGMLLDEGLDFDGRLPDIPEMADGLEYEDLHFLEVDNSPPEPAVRSEGLSVRTRAVAQYLSKNSPAIPKPNGSATKELSLNQILEGRKAKVCARMFQEILVLRSFGMVEVRQEEPYGDIKLAITAAMAKA